MTTLFLFIKNRKNSTRRFKAKPLPRARSPPSSNSSLYGPERESHDDHAKGTGTGPDQVDRGYGLDRTASQLGPDALPLKVHKPFEEQQTAPQAAGLSLSAEREDTLPKNEQPPLPLGSIAAAPQENEQQDGPAVSKASKASEAEQEQIPDKGQHDSAKQDSLQLHQAREKSQAPTPRSETRPSLVKAASSSDQERVASPAAAMADGPNFGAELSAITDQVFSGPDMIARPYEDIVALFDSLKKLRVDETAALSDRGVLEYEGFEHRVEWSFQVAEHERLMEKTLPFGRFGILFRACKTVDDINKLEELESQLRNTSSWTDYKPFTEYIQFTDALADKKADLENAQGAAQPEPAQSAQPDLQAIIDKSK